VAGPVRLAVDLGTSHTVAVAHLPHQPPRALLFDGSPLLPSAVFAAADGTLHTGHDARGLARAAPERFEPHPNRRAGDGAVLLGDAAYPVATLLGAVLRRVLRAAAEVGVAPTDGTVLTCPADWGRTRRGVLLDAARSAGMTACTLVDEPVAAATYALRVLRRDQAVGQALAVFDFGGGTLDVAVVRREQAGLRVVATGGLDDLGGLDIDAALVAHLGRLVQARDPALWQRLSHPAGPGDLRDRLALWSEVRTAKEMLSRVGAAPVELPGTVAAVHLTREELEQVAGPLVDRAVEAAARVVSAAGGVSQLLLVGGSSRIPLVATRLHTRLGRPPDVPDQPELPVAYGAMIAMELLAQPVPTAGPVTATDHRDRVRPGDPPVDDPVPPPAPPPRRRGFPRALVAAVAVLVVAVGAAGVWYATHRDRQAGQHLGTGRSPGGSTGSTGVSGAVAGGGAPDGYAACTVAGTHMYCPQQPVCWSEITPVDGRPTAHRIGCDEPHYWESFAAGDLPAGVAGLPSDKLRTDQSIGRVCADAVLAARSSSPGDTQGWTVTVLPQESASGPAVFHCLAAPPDGGARRGHAFRG
jgi:molecular chaperone HscA